MASEPEKKMEFEMQSWMVSVAIGIITAGVAILSTMNSNKASGRANETIVARLDRSAEELWSISNKHSNAISVIELQVSDINKELAKVRTVLTDVSGQGLRMEQAMRTMPTNKSIADVYVSKEILLEKQRHLYTQIDPMKLQIDKLMERS